MPGVRAPQHQQTGRGWMPQELVFSSALHHIPYTHVAVLNNPFSQQTRSELCSTANLASPLFTRCFASVTSAISNVDQDLKEQRSPNNSTTGQAPHSVPTTNTLSWDSFGHTVVSGSSIFSPKGRAWFQSIDNTEKTDSVDYPEDLQGGGMGREIHHKKKVFPQLKEKKSALFGTLKVLKLIHFCLLHSAAQVHTASSSVDLFKILWALLQHKCSDSEQLLLTALMRQACCFCTIYIHYTQISFNNYLGCDVNPSLLNLCLQTFGLKIKINRKLK